MLNLLLFSSLLKPVVTVVLHSTWPKDAKLRLKIYINIYLHLPKRILLKQRLRPDLAPVAQMACPHRVSLPYTSNPTCDYGVRCLFSSLKNELNGLPYPHVSWPGASRSFLTSSSNLLQHTGLDQHNNYWYAGLTMEQLGLDLVSGHHLASRCTDECHFRAQLLSIYCLVSHGGWGLPRWYNGSKDVN